MFIRKIEEGDYDNILVKWWKNWGFDPPNKDFLPDNGTGGLILFDGEEPVCAGFIYATNSKVAWIEWIVSSKTYRKKPKRKEALDLLVYTLIVITKSTGVKYVFSNNDNKNLIDCFVRNGFKKGCTNSTELIKIF